MGGRVEKSSPLAEVRFTGDQRTRGLSASRRQRRLDGAINSRAFLLCVASFDGEGSHGL
jgi:hypothetical protein